MRRIIYFLTSTFDFRNFIVNYFFRAKIIFFFNRFLFSRDMLLGIAATGSVLGALWWGWTQIPIYFRKTIHRWLQKRNRNKHEEQQT